MSEIDNDTLRRVVRDYLCREESIFLTREGTSTDQQIDCPACGGYRTIEYRMGWRCLKFCCDFAFPDHFIPPSPDEFREYLESKKKTERIMAIDAMVHDLGLELL